jgi:biopolymer transport protein ExbD
MLTTWRKSAPITANDATFTLTMAVVLFVAIVCEMTLPELNPHHCGISVDLPRIDTPAILPRSRREDAITIVIYRSGDVFLGGDLVRLERLPELIRKDVGLGSERRVYIRADARTYYRNVKQVIDAVHAAGLTEISFLAEHRRPQGTL